MRPVEITPEVEDQLYNLISAGNYPAIACQAVGVSPSTYNRWLKRGEYRDLDGNPTPDMVRFAQRMREAEAKAEVEIVKVITSSKTLESNPELGLKFLARRYKARWAESKEVNVHWTIKAVQAIKDGELAIEDLEAEAGKEIADQVRLMLDGPDTIDGTFTPVEEAVKEENVK